MMKIHVRIQATVRFHTSVHSIIADDVYEHTVGMNFPIHFRVEARLEKPRDDTTRRC